MVLFDIYNATLRWRGCADTRPWIIVGPRVGADWDCSRSRGQYSAGNTFTVEMGHPDFPATGLSKTCHIHYGSIIQVPESCFDRRRGCLGGELLAEFRKASGI